MGKKFCSTENNSKNKEKEMSSYCHFVLWPSHNCCTPPPAILFSHQIGRKRVPVSPPVQRLLLSAVRSGGHEGFTMTRHPAVLRPLAALTEVRAGSQGEIQVSQFRVSYEITTRNRGSR